MRHEHVFLGQQHSRNERRTWLVVGLTSIMMVAEIIAGAVFGSMALMADGLHMSTHAAALAIAAVAYLFARRHARDPRFTFGTGKLGELAGFASAIILAVIALLIGIESLLRIWTPVAISFDQAIFVAVIGLGVNLLSAWLLGGDHGHSHGHHDHGHDHHHHHHHAHDHHGHEDHHHHDYGQSKHTDHNLQSAYVHVLADALTSLLAIIGLITARSFGWLWIDPVIGIVGAVIIGAWSWSLIRSSGAVLLDTVPDAALATAVRQRLERHGDYVEDLHLWRVGPGHSALIASIASAEPKPVETYKQRLSGIEGLSHVTIEIQPLPA